MRSVVEARITGSGRRPEREIEKVPTYDYVCGKCGDRFELFQKMSDPPRKRCPKCRGSVRRLIGAGAGLLFKGDGFYVTDYRSKEYQAKVKSEKADTKKEKPAGDKKDEKSSTPTKKEVTKKNGGD